MAGEVLAASEREEIEADGKSRALRRAKLLAKAEHKDILGAADVAALVGCDVKTIHNWLALGRITGFRSPGRHLRFTRDSVRSFLTGNGYPVPAWLETDKAA